jgi:uncharacterized membrane protein YhaH (DUF805 family)
MQKTKYVPKATKVSCLQGFKRFFKYSLTNKGTASNSEYWYGYLVVVIMNIISMVLFALSPIYIVLIEAIIIDLLPLVPMSSVMARRLHDINMKTYLAYGIIVLSILSIGLQYYSLATELNLVYTISSVTSLVCLAMWVYIGFKKPVLKNNPWKSNEQDTLTTDGYSQNTSPTPDIQYGSKDFTTSMIPAESSQDAPELSQYPNSTQEKSNNTQHSNNLIEL